MKKLFTSHEYKVRNQVKNKKRVKRQKRLKSTNKDSNSSSHYAYSNEDKAENYRKAYSLEERYSGYVFVWAPKLMSFIRNTTYVLTFINNIRYHFKKGRKVFVRLDNVVEIDHDAIVLLLSIMVQFKSHKIDFNGSFPSDGHCKGLLRESGFLTYLYKSKFEAEDNYNLSNSIVHTSANKDVDAVLSERIITEASKTVWGEKRRCQGVQRALIELMHNTNNHADPAQERKEHFWISVNHRKSENKVSFAFLDFGVGVFTSLDNKPSGNKFYNWELLLRSVHTFDSNARLLQLILNGSLHETVTGKFYRGKGLPGIKDVLSRNQISNLYIITNNVRACVSEDKYELLGEDFKGTFVYWELDTLNDSFAYYEENIENI